MNRRLKQILIGATIVAFTACGGGGSSSSNTETPSDNTRGESSNIGHGSRLKKETTIRYGMKILGKGEITSVMEYSYNSDGVLSKQVYNFLSDTIQHKSITTMTYNIDKYKPIKMNTKTYNSNDELISMRTVKFTYDGDNVISIKSANSSSVTDVNYSDFVDGLETVTTSYTYHPKTMKGMFKSRVEHKVLDSKVASKTTTDINLKHDNKTTVSTKTYEYDSLNRRTVTTLIDDKSSFKNIITYVPDTTKVAPYVFCFGKYAELEKIHKKKYPKSANSCGLRAKGEGISEVYGIMQQTSSIIYEYTFNDEGLVIETRLTDMSSGEVVSRTTYEYETY